MIFMTAAWAIAARAQVSAPFQSVYPGGLFDNPAGYALDTSRMIRYQIMSFGMGAGTSDGNLKLTALKGPAARMIREHLIPAQTDLNAWGGADVKGPGIVLPMKKNLKLSILTRMRVLGNINGLDGRLISEIGEYDKIPKTYPYTVQVQDMHTRLFGFSEVAAGLSGKLLSKGNHRIGWGALFKLLMASGHTAMQFDNLTGDIHNTPGFDDVVYLSNAEGRVRTRTAGVLFDDFSIGRLLTGGKPSAGMDLGLQYAFYQEGAELPLLQAGISVTDIGTLKYTPQNDLAKEYQIGISTEERLYFNNHFDNADFSKTAEVYDRYPEFFTPVTDETADYRVTLPTALKLQAKAQLTGTFSLAADASVNLAGKNNWIGMQNTEWVRMVPQWNYRNASWVAPVTFSTYQRVSSGLGFRYKGFMVGSNGLFTSLLTEARTFDFYLGISGRISHR